jgi:hypothetical protein
VVAVALKKKVLRMNVFVAGELADKVAAIGG